MNDILPTLYKFIYATLIKVSMLTRKKNAAGPFRVPHLKGIFFHQ